MCNMSYLYVTKGIAVKKTPIKLQDGKSGIVQEPAAMYHAPQRRAAKRVIVKAFHYSDFKKIANKAPFIIAEWAEILHISERTLHRYAKDNAEFSGLQIELILLSEKLIDMGNQVFGFLHYKNFAGFGRWIME